MKCDEELKREAELRAEAEERERLKQEANKP